LPKINLKAQNPETAKFLHLRWSKWKCLAK